MWKNPGKPCSRTVEILAVLAVFVVLASCSRGGGGDDVVVPRDAVIRLSDQFSSDFSLLDMNGQPANSTDFRGKILIVYFGFTTCPDVCPLALSRLSAALNALSKSEQSEVVPLFITIDPARDTPEALKAYLAFDERILGLTGSAAQIDAARTSFKVYARRQPLPGSALGYTMDHSSLFYLVNRRGQPQFALHDSLKPEELAAVLRRNIRG